MSTAPSVPAGAVDISVTNPSTTPAVLSGAFTYYPPGRPNVATTPSAAGGLSIVLAGTSDI